MKLKKEIPLLVLFGIILLNDSYMLFFSSNSNHFYQLIFTIIMIIYLFVFCNHTMKTVLHNIPQIKIYSFVVVFSFLFVFSCSKLKYSDQTIARTLIGDSGHYKMLLTVLILPLTYICYRRNGVQVLFKILNVFTAINFVLTTIQLIIYPINGLVFLQGYFVNNAALLLNGVLKMVLPWFSNIMLIYNFYMFFMCQDQQKKRYKWIYLTIWILGIINLVITSRARGVIMCLAISYAGMILLDKNTKSGIAKKIFFVVIIFIGVFVTGTITDFIQSFSVTATRAYSTTARLYAISYYWNYFLNHPLFGFGFADYLSHYSIIHGDGRAAISDVGIFGQLAKYGVFIIPIYIYPIFRSFNIIKKTWNSQFVKNNLLYLGLYIYMVTSSISIIAIDQFRMLCWPVFLTIIEFIWYAHNYHVEINEV